MAERFVRSQLRVLAIMHIAASGGPPQHVRPWLEALAEHADLEVAVPGAGGVGDLYSGFARVTVLSYEAPTLPDSFRGIASLPRQLAQQVRMFRRHIRCTKPDLVMIVTTALPTAVLAARLERVPTMVYVAEMFGGYHARGLLRRVATEVRRWMHPRLAEALICCSDAVAEQFHDVRKRPKITTVYPGIDVDALNGDPSFFRTNQAGPYLAIIGNVTRGRGQDVALRALPAIRRSLPDVRCLVVGNPLPRARDLAYDAELRQLAGELGVNDIVTFTGFVDRIADVYAAADVIVNPARVPEALGRVALEALVARRPVISSRVGAVPEVLEDGKHALLVEPNDPGAIAVAVEKLWRDDELRGRLVEDGRAYVLTRFDEQDSIEAFLRVVDEMLAQPRRG